jgi:predicted RNA binding protein YcfA (HicA-like mRNA interferase family)
VKRADLERHLRRHGCQLKREGANHAIWENSAREIWSSVPRHREVKEFLVRKICRQLEIPTP